MYPNRPSDTQLKSKLHYEESSIFNVDPTPYKTVLNEWANEAAFKSWNQGHALGLSYKFISEITKSGLLEIKINYINEGTAYGAMRYYMALWGLRTDAILNDMLQVGYFFSDIDSADTDKALFLFNGPKSQVTFNGETNWLYDDTLSMVWDKAYKWNQQLCFLYTNYGLTAYMFVQKGKPIYVRGFCDWAFGSKMLVATNCSSTMTGHHITSACVY